MKLCLVFACVVLMFSCSRSSEDSRLGSVDNGKRLIFSYGCASCHEVEGLAEQKSFVGPPLTDWEKRKYIAGSLVNKPENLIEWILRPQDFEPGTAMPDLGVSKEQAKDMAAFLFRNKERSLTE